MNDFLDQSLGALLAELSGDEPVPAVGSAAAVSASLAAAVLVKVARRSVAVRADARVLAETAERLKDRLAPLAYEDATAYRGVARSLSRGGDRATVMASACVVPMRLAEAAMEVAVLAAELTATGNRNLRYDAAGAARMSAGAALIAATLVHANVGPGDDSNRAAELAERADRAARNARREADIR